MNEFKYLLHIRSQYSQDTSSTREVLDVVFPRMDEIALELRVEKIQSVPFKLFKDLNFQRLHQRICLLVKLFDLWHVLVVIK